METVGTPKQILRPERVYSQEYIRKRMGKTFGQSGSLLESVLSKCAEVSQAMMYEVLEKAEPAVTIQRKGWMVRQEYYCPGCKRHKIRALHNYCPNCGHKINWIN